MDRYDELLGGYTPSRSAEPPVGVTVPAPAGGDMAMGAYEGADRLNSAIALWSSPLRSADADILPEKDEIDGRTRDLLRNDAYVQGGSNLHKDNIVGSHYLLNTRPDSRLLFNRVDDVWEEEFQEEVEFLWGLYADSPDNWVDAARTNDFTSMVRMAVGIHVMAGEVLATAEWVKDDGAPLSTAIQMVDVDRLSKPKDGKFTWWNADNQRAGVKYNARGAPVSYFIRSSHPSDFGPAPFEMPSWKEIPARKPWGRRQVIHLFEQQRPEQSRGITEMASAVKEAKMTKTWRDINVQHAVASSLYAAAITSDLPSDVIAATLGAGQNSEAVQSAISNYAEGYLGSIARYAGSARGLAIDGVKIPHLYPGTKLELLSPGKGGPLGQPFEQSLLRYMAAALGVSYEQLSRDYTNTNYSSARAAMNETWKHMVARKKLIADRFASLIYRLWLEEAINKGLITALPRGAAGRIYTGGRLNLTFDSIARCDWVGASRGQIDELKETQAAVLRINNGLSTAEDELARLGKDWRKVYRQLKREQALRDTLKLVFPGSKDMENALSAEASDEGTAPKGSKE